MGFRLAESERDDPSALLILAWTRAHSFSFDNTNPTFRGLDRHIGLTASLSEDDAEALRRQAEPLSELQIVEIARGCAARLAAAGTGGT